MHSAELHALPTHSERRNIRAISNSWVLVTGEDGQIDSIICKAMPSATICVQSGDASQLRTYCLGRCNKKLQERVCVCLHRRKPSHGSHLAIKPQKGPVHLFWAGMLRGSPHAWLHPMAAPRAARSQRLAHPMCLQRLRGACQSQHGLH
jgi:hypothetical protein